VIYFTNPGYTRNTAYRIDKVEKTEAGSRIFLHATTGLGVGRVESAPDARTLVSSVPHEYANSVRRSPGWGTPGAGTGSGFFSGKRIRSASGAETRIVSARFGNPMTLAVESSAGFKPGEVFYYDDIQPDDSFVIPGVIYKPGEEPVR